MVPQAPVLVAGFRDVIWLSPEGEIEALSPDEAARRVQIDPPMLCHAIATARRLDSPGFAALDLLELFAFVHPARFCVPTPRGLADALGLPPPQQPDRGLRHPRDRGAGTHRIAWARDRRRNPCHRRGHGSWWMVVGPAVLAALPTAEPRARRQAAGLRVWTRLAEWAETAPGPPPGNEPVTPDGGAPPARPVARGRGRAASAASRLRRRCRRRLCPARGDATSRTRCSPKPAPASAKPSGILRPQACGPRKTAARCGSRPSPAISRARSRRARSAVSRSGS